MPIVQSVGITWNRKKLAEIDHKFVEAVFDLGFDIAAQARRNAPYVTGALRNSIRVEEASGENAILVRAGGVVSSGTHNGARISRNVDYAYKREIGPNRNPATEHYMANAQRAIMSGNYIQKYFGGITK